ncbi:hypothetical protein GCM10012319_68130 [Comamonas sp. KCTC 72670]|nr:hypothetical protein GCM10012319_68130 [Comamonas sp. KCTC 72670]
MAHEDEALQAQRVGHGLDILGHGLGAVAPLGVEVRFAHAAQIKGHGALLQVRLLRGPLLAPARVAVHEDDGEAAAAGFRDSEPTRGTLDGA